MRPVLVVSQPARPRGRGRSIQQPPVARWATEAGLGLTQPERVRDPAFLEHLQSLQVSVAVVVAFGQIFPRELLELPAHGCINVHASLLPRHRGAAPVQASIIAGDRRTGVTTMLMDEGLDTGPILLQRETVIGPEETAGELTERLAVAGAELLIDTLGRLQEGSLEARSQDESNATLAPRLDRSAGIIDWRAEADRIFDLMRGLSPWPGVSSELRGRPVKILWGHPVRGGSTAGESPGTYLGLIDGRIAVACGGETVFGIERLQAPGRKPLPAEVFVNGQRLAAGERFA